MPHKQASTEVETRQRWTRKLGEGPGHPPVILGVEEEEEEDDGERMKGEGEEEE